MSDIPLDLEWVGLDEAFEEFERELTETARGLTVLAWNRTLSETPQFFGRLAASWSYSIGRPIAVDRSEVAMFDRTGDLDLGPFPGLRKGHPDAIATANFYSTGKELPFKLGDTVYFANGADHGEGAYAQAIEDGEVGLRPGNQPGRMASRALDWVQARYGVGMTPTSAAMLRKLRIGGPDV